MYTNSMLKILLIQNSFCLFSHTFQLSDVNDITELLIHI